MTNNDEGGGHIPPTKHLLSIREAGELMGISERQCRRLLEISDFPAIKTSPGRTKIPRGRLLDWLGYYHLSTAPVADSRHGLTVVPNLKGDHS